MPLYYYNYSKTTAKKVSFFSTTETGSTLAFYDKPCALYYGL
ncbi:MAG: hypothetical protein PF439_01435 [Helicobacteraceae bacterium]|jgi:hypothetical protein|nr:hypothetical protein [Helicobacteraceae bacterium]